MDENRILIIDDDKELLDLLKKVLEKNGFMNVSILSDPIQAESVIIKEKPELILLDIMMPNLDGITLLKKIRTYSDVPLILLTAKGEDEDKYLGFESGADDYIVKPFLMKELVLRIKAVLKRRPKPYLIRLGDIEIDLGTAIVKRDDKEINLTAKEYKLLNCLYNANGNLVPIQNLCRELVGEVWEGYENTLMSHVRHLRQKIEPNPNDPKYLLTVKGLGYRLICD